MKGGKGKGPFELIVTGIPPVVSKDELMKFFSFFKPLYSKIDRSNHTATIAFKTAQDRNNALTMDNTQLIEGAAPIRVKKAEDSNNLSVSVTTCPLAPITAEDLAMFTMFRPTSKVIATDGLKARITFACKEAMDAALRLDGKVVASKKYFVKPWDKSNVNNTQQQQQLQHQQQERPKQQKSYGGGSNGNSNGKGKGTRYMLRVSGFNFYEGYMDKVVSEAKRIFKLSGYVTVEVDTIKMEMTFGYNTIEGLRSGMTYNGVPICGNRLTVRPVIAKRYEATVSYIGKHFEKRSIETAFRKYNFLEFRMTSHNSFILTFDNPASLNHILAQNGTVYHGRTIKVTPVFPQQSTTTTPPQPQQKFDHNEKKKSTEGGNEGECFKVKLIGFSGTIEDATFLFKGMRPKALLKLSKRTYEAYLNNKKELMMALSCNKQVYKGKLVHVKEINTKLTSTEAYVTVKGIPKPAIANIGLREAILDSLLLVKTASRTKFTKTMVKLFFKDDAEAIAFKKANNARYINIASTSVQIKTVLCPRIRSALTQFPSFSGGAVDTPAAAPVGTQNNENKKPLQQQSNSCSSGGNNNNNNNNNINNTLEMSNTLSVSGLPLNTNRKTLLDLFADYKPLRGDVVGNKKTSGYVIFRSPEDARRALENINGLVCKDDTGSKKKYVLRVSFSVKKTRKNQKNKSAASASAFVALPPRIYPGVGAFSVKLRGLTPGNSKEEVAGLLGVPKKMCAFDMNKMEGVVHLASADDVERVLGLGPLTLNMGNVVTVERDVENYLPPVKPHVVSGVVSNGVLDVAEDALESDDDDGDTEEVNDEKLHACDDNDSDSSNNDSDNSNSDSDSDSSNSDSNSVSEEEEEDDDDDDGGEEEEEEEEDDDDDDGGDDDSDDFDDV